MVIHTVILQEVSLSNQVPALIADPFCFMIFTSSILHELGKKLGRRDDFAVLPKFRTGGFVPRYARNLFIDHGILLGQIICKMWIWKMEWKTAFRALLFLFSWVSASAFVHFSRKFGETSFQACLVVPTIGKGPHILLDSLRILLVTLSLLWRACVKKHNRNVVA